MHGRTNLTAIRLMDACEHLLCECEALEDLTARRIAVEAHVTPSAIAYHFGCQEALVAAVAERVYRRLNAERLSLLRRAVDRQAPDPSDPDAGICSSGCPIAGAVIADAFGWRAIFISLGAAAALAMLNAVRRWDETLPAGASEPRRTFSPMLRDPGFWTYTLGFQRGNGNILRILLDRPAYTNRAG